MLNTKIRTIQTTARYAVAAAVLVSLALLVNFIPVSTASGTPGLLVEKIVAHRDFFTRVDVGYDEYLLCDVNDALGENRLGLLLMEPAGFLKSVVFDRGTLQKIHEEVSIPPKKLRSDLSRGSVSISDARLIAGNIAGLREKGKNLRRKATPPATPRREAMPQSLPASPTGSQKSFEPEKVLNRMREEVAQNSELSSLESSEILERFRSDVQNSSKSRKEVHSQ
jgi:hypothetical protein